MQTLRLVKEASAIMELCSNFVQPQRCAVLRGVGLVACVVLHEDLLQGAVRQLQPQQAISQGPSS